MLNRGLQMNDLPTEFPAYPKFKLRELQFLKEQLSLLYNVILSITKYRLFFYNKIHQSYFDNSIHLLNDK